MAVLRKVTFRFPTDTQIRYVEESPRRGDRVRGLDGELLIVAHTEHSESGDLATCVRPVEYAPRHDPRQGGSSRGRAQNIGGPET